MTNTHTFTWICENKNQIDDFGPNNNRSKKSINCFLPIFFPQIISAKTQNSVGTAASNTFPKQIKWKTNECNGIIHRFAKHLNDTRGTLQVIYLFEAGGGGHYCAFVLQINLDWGYLFFFSSEKSPSSLSWIINLECKTWAERDRVEGRKRKWKKYEFRMRFNFINVNKLELIILSISVSLSVEFRFRRLK